MNELFLTYDITDILIIFHMYFASYFEFIVSGILLPVDVSVFVLGVFRCCDFSFPKCVSSIDEGYDGTS
jgi:hypothetical protein